MSFYGEYFQQIFGIIIGTNLTLILANLFLSMLQEELKKKYKFDKNLKWPILIQVFIDDGFGIMEGSTTYVEYIKAINFKKLHTAHTIEKYILEEIKRYVKFNSIKITF